MGIVLTFVVNAMRVWRWQVLTHGVGFHSPLPTAWRAYHIGTFLGTITPAKMGELGRVAYLGRDRASMSAALGLLIVERIADVATMGMLAIGAVGLLFGETWFLRVAAAIVGALLLIILVMFWTHRFLPASVRDVLKKLRAHHVLLPFIFMTIFVWSLYFIWCISFAWSRGITIPTLSLAAAFTIAAAVAVLPIAPSGLGTRDAALITLLTPFGLPSTHAVALSLLIFLAILLASTPGLFYWITANRRS